VGGLLIFRVRRVYIYMYIYIYIIYYPLYILYSFSIHMYIFYFYIYIYIYTHTYIPVWGRTFKYGRYPGHSEEQIKCTALLTDHNGTLFGRFGYSFSKVSGNLVYKVQDLS